MLWLVMVLSTDDDQQLAEVTHFGWCDCFCCIVLRQWIHEEVFEHSHVAWIGLIAYTVCLMFKYFNKVHSCTLAMDRKAKKNYYKCNQHQFISTT